jgi:mRNA interferase YafQ
MKPVKVTNKFSKDFKLMIKMGKDPSKLFSIVDDLVADKNLPDRCRPYKLVGNYSDKWECHIETDWQLIYENTDEFVTLYRTGTHSDLFIK